MRPVVKVDIERILGALTNVEKKQAPWALKWAVETTAADATRAVQDVIRRRFEASTRGMQFLLNHVKVLTPGSPLFRIHASSRPDSGFRLMVGVIPPEGKGQNAGWSRYRGSLLPMMEDGGPTPGPRDFGGVVGLGRYAIPDRRPTDRTPVPMSMFPINLKLQARQSIEGPVRGGGLRGKRRTFLLPIANNPGRAVIFQRYGRGRNSDVMPLFYTQPQTRLPARRFFFSTAMRTINQTIGAHARGAMMQAVHGTGRYTGQSTAWQGPLRARPSVVPWTR